MKKIGYLRVSTREQCVDRQVRALEDICDELHVERLSALSPKRPIYNKVVRSLRAGDSLVILDLDRAYRSTEDALSELKRLKRRGVFLQVVNLALDTSSPFGMFFYTIIAACAALERQMLSQRTKEGLAAARARGKILGRPRKLDAEKIERARGLLAKPGATYTSVAPSFDVSPLTLARSLHRGGSR